MTPELRRWLLSGTVWRAHLGSKAPSVSRPAREQRHLRCALFRTPLNLAGPVPRAFPAGKHLAAWPHLPAGAEWA